MKKKIITARLIIEPYKETDNEELKELLTNEDIKKTFMIPDFKTEEELDKMANRLILLSQDNNRFERGIYFQDMLIGFVNDFEIKNDSIELGYVIHPNYQNKGFATEILKAVIEELLPYFSTVIAGAFCDNVASIRVMEKCGMKKIDKEGDIAYQGKTKHCIYYAISQ